MKNKKSVAIVVLLCFMMTLIPAAAFADTVKPVATLEELQKALLEDEANIQLTKTIVVTSSSITLDLNGKKITAAEDVNPLFRIQADNVTVKNGTVDARNGVAYAFIVGTHEEAANLIIESGTYYGETSAVSVTKGSLTVNGGEFAVNPYLQDNYTYLLNCIDANYQNDTADIVVKGGTFHNYNPADNEAEGPGTDWVPEGYAAVNTENVWNVIQTAVSGITLDKTTASVNTGKNISLTATVTPDTALDKEVIWTSDNTDIATVENGVVTGVKAGSAVITATTKDGGYTAQCTVTVTKPYTGSSGFSGSYNYPVKVESAKDAEVVLSDNNASKGETVTITVKPEAGKDVKDVIITDANGNVIPVIKTADNQYTFVMPEGKVNISPATENADYDSKIVLQIGNRSTAVNGEEFSNDVAPVIIGDRTMVPIRVIIESLGGAADWDEATRTVTLTIGGQVLRMVIDEIIGGFDAAPMIMNGRTYVPVRYIAEAVGAQVEWIEASQQIVIKN